MNFGHGDAPLYACPSAKSAPVAENSTVFSVSAPIAFDAAAIVVPASCAAATDANRATASAARIDLLVIVPSKQQLTRADTTTHPQGPRAGCARTFLALNPDVIAFVKDGLHHGLAPRNQLTPATRARMLRTHVRTPPCSAGDAGAVQASHGAPLWRRDDADWRLARDWHPGVSGIGRDAMDSSLNQHPHAARRHGTGRAGTPHA